MTSAPRKPLLLGEIRGLKAQDQEARGRGAGPAVSPDLGGVEQSGLGRAVKGRPLTLLESRPVQWAHALF